MLVDGHEVTQKIGGSVVMRPDCVNLLAVDGTHVGDDMTRRRHIEAIVAPRHPVVVSL